jgi:hypothetical protein
MPRAKSQGSAQLVEVPPNPELEGSSPQLEEPTPQIKAVVGGVVNVADNGARQLDSVAPGWAYFLRQFVDVTDGVMRGGE